jgi:hypothetical protein
MDGRHWLVVMLAPSTDQSTLFCHDNPFFCIDTNIITETDHVVVVSEMEHSFFLLNEPSPFVLSSDYVYVAD